MTGPAVQPVTVVHLAARVGRMLMINGADTRHTCERMSEVASLLGQPAHLLVTGEAIVISAGHGDVSSTSVGIAIPAMAVDMGKLIAIEQAVDILRRDPYGCDSVAARLDDVEASVGVRPGWMVVVGMAITAGALARLFSATWPVVASAFAAGIISTILRRLLGHHHLNPIAATFLTGLLSALAAEGVIRLAPGESPVLCLTAAGMILVPGVPLLNGVRDLMSGHASNAVARLVLGAVTTLVIGFALFLASGLMHGTLPVDQAPGVLPVGEDILFSAIAAVGFSMLFNVPTKAVLGCVFCGIASHGLRTSLEAIGMGLATSSLISAFAAGIVAQISSRIFLGPPIAFAFPGIVAMIPGSYAFRAAIAGLQIMALGSNTPPALIATMLSLVLTTIIVTAAIGIGLSLALAAISDRRPLSWRTI